MLIIQNVLKLFHMHHVQWYTWIVRWTSGAGHAPQESSIAHNRACYKHLPNTTWRFQSYLQTSTRHPCKHASDKFHQTFFYSTKLNASGRKARWNLFTHEVRNLKTPAVGLTQVERNQIHTHLPRRWSCLCSTDGQSMGPEIAQLLTATSLHSKKIIH